MAKIDLSVEFAGVRFKNPVVASAGHVTQSLVNLKNCVKAGVGGIEMKSLSLDKETWGRPRPAIWFLDRFGDPCTQMHCEMAFWTPEQAVINIKEIKPLAKKADTKVIANIILGKWSEGESETLIDLAKRVGEAGADMIAATTFCPLTIPPEERENLEKEQIRFIVKTLKGQISIPFYIKGNRFTHELFFLKGLKLLEELGKSEVPLSATSSIPGTLIDIESGKPLMPIAHIYGRHRRPVECYATFLVSTKSKLQYMSSGGLWTSRDVIERLMCGATLTAVCTSAMYKGYGVFKEMIDGLEAFLKRKDYKSVRELIGIASPYVHDLKAFTEFVAQRVSPKDALMITVDAQKCNACGRCTVCNDSAITVENGIAKIDLELCQRCGVCASICPTGAITICR